MAACKLVIRFDDPRPRSGGEPITGTITVRSDKQVHCKALVAKCIWSTHGRGNIDSGEVDSQVLYEGPWQAGQEVSYPFKLNTAAWPPTYYGNYLNVGHYVTAQAKLSWATDPKAQVEFPVTALAAPDDLKPTTGPTKPSGIIGLVIGGILAVIVLGVFSAFLIFLLPLIAVIAALVWFFRSFLPKRITGPVVCELKTPKATAGGKVEAHMQFTPGRTSTINGIDWTISCVEQCSSGSGSNRQTHRYEVLKETTRVSERLELKAGQTYSFDFAYTLPADAPPSLKFSDNQVDWIVQGRIDIPSWPDWVKKLPVAVAPGAGAAGQTLATESAGTSANFGGPAAAAPLAAGALPPVVAPTLDVQKAQADEAWFREVIQQIQQSQHDQRQLAIVISAIRQFQFSITAIIEDEIDTPEFEDPEEFERLDEWEWWTAFCPAQNVALALAWNDYPASIRPGASWTGTASIVGYDIDAKRILMVVEGET
jgi:hypothetical protein